MKKCLNQGCENLVTSVPGRRPRQYCSNTCRQKGWQRKNKEKLAQFRGRGGESLPADYVEVKNIGVITPEGTVKPLFKPKAAPNPEKLPDVPKKEDKGGNGAQNVGNSIPGVTQWIKETEDFLIEAVPKNENNPQPPEGLTGIPLMVWKNEQKKKTQVKKPPITNFGSGQKEKENKEPF